MLQYYPLSSVENDFYEALYTQSKAQFDTYVSSGTVLNNYAHIFDILIRLRQAVDHPYLVVHSSTRPPTDLQLLDAPSTSASLSPSPTIDECRLCHEIVDEKVNSTCGHTFCDECINEYTSTMAAESAAKVRCPVCGEVLTILMTHDAAPTNTIPLASTKIAKKSILNSINLGSFQSSTKLEALMQVAIQFPALYCGDVV